MRCLLMLSLFFGALQTAAGEETSSSRFYSKLGTVFPLSAGVGLGYSDGVHWQLEAGVGFTPKPYYETIGTVAADSGGNASYKEVLEAAFQNNSLWGILLQYNLSGPREGWSFGVAASELASTGEAGIDQVLAAATGRDYTQLKNLLVLAHRDPNVDMTSRLLIGEIQAGHAWEWSEHWVGRLSVGVAQVLSSDVHLKTGLPNFEASAAGSNLMRSSESELESIINKYGLSPTVGFSASYFF